MNLLNGLRWLRNGFIGFLDWTPTANRTLNLPDKSGIIALTDDINNLSKVRYLFVIAGESNSGGLAVNNTLTADQLLPQSHAKIWNNTTSTFQSLQIGTNNLISHTVLSDNISHGIERGLAREILNTLQFPEAYILKSGQGGSTIAQWSVGNATGYLTTLTNRFNAARTALTSQGFIVRPIFIWFNGINDALGGTAPATFRTSTQAHFTQIRTLMGSSTSIFMPQIMPTTAAYTAINTEINAIDTSDSNMWALPTVNIASNPSDINHYTANGYLQIARSFVDTFRNTLGIPGTFNIGQSRAVSSNPIVSLKRSTAFTVAHNVNVVIPMNLVEIDTDNMFRDSDGTVVIANGAEGIYQITGMATTGGSQQVRVIVLINGVNRSQSQLMTLGTDSSWSGETTRIIRLSIADVVSLAMLQINTTSATRDLFLQPEFQSCLQMVRIGL